jgi:hypothetical protein
MMEAVVALAVLLHEFDFSLVPNQTIGMTTGLARLWSLLLHLFAALTNRLSSCNVLGRRPAHASEC